MTNFQFSNEEIIYLHSHFSDYLETLEGDLQKQNQFVAGQLELLEQTYGNTPDFDHEQHALYKELMGVEMPKMLAEKANFIRTLKDKFSRIYEIIEESDPDYVANVKNDIFGQPQHIKDLIEKLNAKETHE